jgi:hypothetical protein
MVLVKKNLSGSKSQETKHSFVVLIQALGE